MKRSFLTAFLAIVFTASVVTGVFNAEASALSGSQFKAGRIIDDSKFYNGETMTASQIQSFLNAKVPTCDTNGTKIFSGSQTRAQYGTSRGYPPPYICLKNYKKDTPYRVGQSGLCSEITAKSNRTAAQIIDDVARACHISEKVIIVMLQKEQGLVTDDWPWSIQYRSAMGYGCPDTAACNSQYYGFFNQVYNAALQFQRYKADPDNWNHVPFMTNQILYQANAPSCGTKSVFIENYATAGLYNYTPYTPNAAALNNLYGTGNSCSAYGNRNFWRYYNDWFGSPIGPAVYNYSVVSKTGYSDSGYVNSLSNPLSIEPNGSAYMKIVVKNTGNQVWMGPKLRLGVSPSSSSSSFVDVSWIAPNRPASMEEESVPPGSNATFKFKIVAPAVLGVYNEKFDVLIEGSRWLEKPFTLPITVETPDPYYMAKATEFSIYSDPGRTKKLNNSSVTAYLGSKFYARVKVKNMSNRSLPADLTKLATTNPLNRLSPFSDDSWASGTRPGVVTGVPLDPGQTTQFEFTMTTPEAIGTYTEQFGLVVEGQRWIETNLGSFEFDVKEKPPDRLLSGQVLPKYGRLMSADERYRLIFQGDGNLVLYDMSKPLWSSRTGGTGSGRLVLQGDGNLVLYSGSKAVWSSRTKNPDVSKLIMQGDGNLVLYLNSGRPIWSTGTRGE